MSFQTSFYSTIFGGSTGSSMTGLYSMASEMKSITSGNYGKLLKSYYSQYGTGSSSSASASSSVSKTKGYDVLEHVSGHKTHTDTTASASKTETSMTSYEKQALQSTATTATDAKNANSALTTLMNKNSYESAPAADAQKSTETDTVDTNGSVAINDKVISAVKTYAKSYNNLIDSSKKSLASGVSANVQNLMDLTQRSKDDLASIGVAVGSDGKLTVDEDTLKQSTNDTVKSVFSNGGSYGTGAATWTSLVNYYASSAASNGTYTSSGSYSAAAASSYNTSV